MTERIGYSGGCIIKSILLLIVSTCTTLRFVVTILKTYLGERVYAYTFFSIIVTQRTYLILLFLNSRS